MTPRFPKILIAAVPALILAATIQTGTAAQTVQPSPAVLVTAATPSAPAMATADTLTADPETAPAPSAEVVDPTLAAQVDCVAKVIVHEAGNQPEAGQVAVAQVIRTRLKAGRFGTDACSVIGQRGQFFDVAAYHPDRAAAAWSNAVAIAARTLAGKGDELVQGALFFHTAGSPMPGRVRVAQIADHVFYR